jgi:hypothetical protein
MAQFAHLSCSIQPTIFPDNFGARKLQSPVIVVLLRVEGLGRVNLAVTGGYQGFVLVVVVTDAAQNRDYGEFGVETGVTGRRRRLHRARKICYKAR